jgi:hypothetical protein
MLMNTVTLSPRLPISPFQIRTIPMQSASILAPAQTSSTIDLNSLINLMLPVIMVAMMMGMMSKMMSSGGEEAQTPAPAS